MIRLGELFCGAGGFSVACKMTKKIDVIWATDIDKHACATYKRNFENTCLQEDVKNLDFNILPNVDALTFGFPCNDFTSQGRKLGLDGPFGNLYQYCVKAVNYFNPYQAGLMNFSSHISIIDVSLN